MNITDIKLAAERGCTESHPENSLPSLVEAIACGALYLTTEVQLSADCLPVLCREEAFTQLSGLTGALHEHSFAALTSTAANPHSKQPLAPLANLSTLLAAHPYVHAFIEIEPVTLHRHSAATVYRQVTNLLAAVMEQCTLLSRSLPFVRYAQQSGWPNLGLALEGWSDEAEKAILSLRPAYVLCDHKQLPAGRALPEQAGSTHKIRMMASGVEDPRRALQLMEQGVQYIATPAYKSLKSALG